MKRPALTLFAASVLGLASLPASAGINDGLVAYYGFENCDGTDSSGNNYDGDVIGTVGCVDTDNGKALSFANGNGYVQSGDINQWDLHFHTIVAWVNVSSVRSVDCLTSRMRTIVGRRAEGDHATINLHLRGKNSGLATNFATGTEDEHLITGNANSLIAPDEWHMVAVTYDGTMARLWVDFQYVKKVARDGAMRTNDVPLAIGRNGGGENLTDACNFQGEIDEVRIYDRALGSRDLQRLYNIRP